MRNLIVALSHTNLKTINKNQRTRKDDFLLTLLFLTILLYRDPGALTSPEIGKHLLTPPEE